MKATAKISKVTRDSKLKLKFISSVFQDNLVSLFQKEMIKINIVSKKNQDVNFTIDFKDHL